MATFQLKSSNNREIILKVDSSSVSIYDKSTSNNSVEKNTFININIKKVSQIQLDNKKITTGNLVGAICCFALSLLFFILLIIQVSSRQPEEMLFSIFIICALLFLVLGICCFPKTSNRFASLVFYDDLHNKIYEAPLVLSADEFDLISKAIRDEQNK